MELRQGSQINIPIVVLIWLMIYPMMLKGVRGRAARPGDRQPRVLPATKGTAWFENRLLPAFQPVTILALLATLVAIFAFQAENILSRINND